MEAQKVTVTIIMEALSIDCLRGLLHEVISHIEGEYENGKLVANDGDSISWDTVRKTVKF